MLDLILSPLLFMFGFTFVISIVVVIHELGHFWTARACGAKVDVFSLGIGPVLYSVKDRKHTEWRLSALPLGGYVKFSGDKDISSFPSAEKLANMKQQAKENGTEKNLKHYFHFLPLWKKVLIVVAGPLANFILGILIFTALEFSFGSVKVEPLVGEVFENSPAQRAGIKPNDYIAAINQKPVESFSDIQSKVGLASGNELIFEINRDHQSMEVIVVPEKALIEDGIGGKVEIGRIGIGSHQNAKIIRETYGLTESFYQGLKRTGSLIVLPVTYLKRVFSGKEKADQLGGPIRIAMLSGMTAIKSVKGSGNIDADPVLGQRLLILLVRLLTITGAISVSLGLINLFPLPVLDGGHLLFYGIEFIIGRPVNTKIMEASFKIGLALILLLFIFVTVNDLIYLGKYYS